MSTIHRRRPRRVAAARADADAYSGLAQGGGRPRGIRTRTGVNTDPMAAARRKASRAQHAADDAGAARRGVLHESRHHAPRGDVHRRRSHGRPRLGRGGERRRLRHGAGDGAGAHLQQPGRADRAHDPLRALEQRGDRDATARAPTSRSVRRCRARKTRPGRASIRSRSGSA